MTTSSTFGLTGSNGSTDFHLKFWGVRGTIACPGSEFVRYGGNTACIEVRCGDRLLILDAGTGLRPLGERLTTAGDGVDADILLSHTHIDHISGLPFFGPLFAPGNKFRMWAGHLEAEGETLQDIVCRIMSAPLFPVPFEALASSIDCREFAAGDALDFGDDIRVRTTGLNHPNGATGYRIEYGGRSICYVTDTEHRDDGLDADILDLIRGTQVFIYDATYTDDEYPAYKGWGHSTWQEGARLAEAAAVDRYVIFHHAPDHDDAFMDDVSDLSRQWLDRTIVAREGLVLRP